MAFVQSVARSIDFYSKLGFEAGNTHTPEGGPYGLAWVPCDNPKLIGTVRVVG